MGRLGTGPRRQEGVIAQAAEDEAVLLDVASGKYFALNSVGSRIWELCDGRSRAEIVAVICDEFDVGTDIAEADTAEILDELSRERLVLED